MLICGKCLICLSLSTLKTIGFLQDSLEVFRKYSSFNDILGNYV